MKEPEEATRTAIKLTYHPMPPEVQTHKKHKWTNAIDDGEDGLLIFCECGAMCDADGVITE